MDITVAKCSKTNSCRRDESDFEVGVKLTSGVGSFHGGGPERASAVRTFKLRLQSREEANLMGVQVAGSIGGKDKVGSRDDLISYQELGER